MLRKLFCVSAVIADKVRDAVIQDMVVVQNTLENLPDKKQLNDFFGEVTADVNRLDEEYAVPSKAILKKIADPPINNAGGALHRALVIAKRNNLHGSDAPQRALYKVEKDVSSYVLTNSYFFASLITIYLFCYVFLYRFAYCHPNATFYFVVIWLACRILTMRMGVMFKLEHKIDPQALADAPQPLSSWEELKDVVQNRFLFTYEHTRSLVQESLVVAMAWVSLVLPFVEEVLIMGGEYFLPIAELLNKYWDTLGHHDQEGYAIAGMGFFILLVTCCVTRRKTYKHRFYYDNKNDLNNPFLY